MDLTQDQRSAQYLGTVLTDLHSVWLPHAGQVDVGRALFSDNKRRVFMRCGRKFGKSEFVIYTLYRWALTRPGGQFYYIAPFYNQAAELLWKPQRLQNFMGEHGHKYIQDIHETDRRITFKNGSFIKLVGSDNYEAGRGLNPDGAAIDEFKDIDYRFYTGFEPNLLAKKAPVLIVGTPPDTFDHFFVRVEEDFKLDPRGAYFKKSTYTNPYIDKEELELEKLASIAKGEMSKFQREIMAEIVPGGALSIFPMFQAPMVDAAGKFVGNTRHVLSEEEIETKITRHRKDWKFYCAFDPGSSICFAAIFMAVNKYTKQVVILDEIYEKDRSKTTGKRIWPRAEAIMKRYAAVKDWYKVYDYAATWFQVEINNEFGVSLMPCIKDVNKKDVALSVIKDFMLEDTGADGCLFQVSSKCEKFIWEVANYATDEDGKIPKANDHLIDALRYSFNSAGLSTIPRNRHVRPDDNRMWTDIDYLDDDEILEQPLDFDSEESDEWYE